MPCCVLTKMPDSLKTASLAYNCLICLLRDSSLAAWAPAVWPEPELLLAEDPPLIIIPEHPANVVTSSKKTRLRIYFPRLVERFYLIMTATRRREYS